MLFHRQQVLDIVDGRLSDSPVLPDEVVEIVANLPGGEFGPNRTIKINQTRTPRANGPVQQESKPTMQQKGGQTDSVNRMTRDENFVNRMTRD